MADRDQHPLSGDAAAYALGALPPDEVARFEAAMHADAALADEVATWREVAAAIGDSASAPAPPSALRNRVIDRIRADAAGSPAPGPRARGWGGRPVAIAAGLGAIGLFGFGWVEARRTNTALERTVSGLRQQLESAQGQLAGSRELLDVLLAPGLQVDVVAGTTEQKPVLRLLRDPARRIAFAVAHGLAPAPEGRTYQLWFIRDGVPVPSVTFNTAADGRAAPVRVELPEGPGIITHAAVTEEPTGGSRAPTMTPFLVGEVSR